MSEPEYDCQICQNSSQIMWRLVDLEGKVADLQKYMVGALASGVITLVGIAASLVYIILQLR